MIIYFTGTGNSRLIAEFLRISLNDEVTDATVYIKSGQHPSFHSELPYIFVSPVYAWRLPRIFEDWINACSFNGNKKAYFIINCGSSIGAAYKYAKRLTDNKSFIYMGTLEVVMPENYIVMFSAPPKEKIPKIIKIAKKKVGKIVDDIKSENAINNVKASFAGHLCSDIINPFFNTFYIGAKKFYSTDKCISCGKCVKNCMLENITLKNGKPIWNKNCTHCMSCISYCPTGAIEYGKHTKGLDRYTCPNDI